jgi:hypothetical protein
MARADPAVSHVLIAAMAWTATVLPFQLLIAVLGGWLNREQAGVIAFLQEENRVLKARWPGGGCVSTTASGGVSRN